VLHAVECCTVSETLAYLERAERRRFITIFGRTTAAIAATFCVSHAIGLWYVPSVRSIRESAAVSSWRSRRSHAASARLAPATSLAH